jgi:hypothetical protein
LSGYRITTACAKVGCDRPGEKTSDPAFYSEKQPKRSRPPAIDGTVLAGARAVVPATHQCEVIRGYFWSAHVIRVDSAAISFPILPRHQLPASQYDALASHHRLRSRRLPVEPSGAKSPLK